MVVDVDDRRADDTCKVVAEAGGLAVPIVVDASESKACDFLAAETVRQFGRIDILVNNAAVNFSRPLLECTDDDWDRTIAINSRSMFFACRAIVPTMISGGGGSIVSISSIGAYRGFGTGAYAASKGTIESLTRDIAFSYGRQGIRANVVAPGHIRSTFVGSSDHPTAIDETARSHGTLLGTVGTGQDVAEAVAFLASDSARWITGITLPVDGGTLVAAPLALATYLRPS